MGSKVEPTINSRNVRPTLANLSLCLFGLQLIGIDLPVGGKRPNWIRWITMLYAVVCFLANLSCHAFVLWNVDRRDNETRETFFSTKTSAWNSYIGSTNYAVYVTGIHLGLLLVARWYWPPMRNALIQMEWQLTPAVSWRKTLVFFSVIGLAPTGLKVFFLFYFLKFTSLVGNITNRSIIRGV